MMGLCLEQTPAMGEYAVEVRRVSFYLTGPMFVYPYDVMPGGIAEINLDDIPKIRACLDAVEAARKD